MSLSGPVRELLLKLLDGITDPGFRAETTAILSMIIGRYASGEIDGATLKRALNELCFDALFTKNPTMDADKIKEEASKWAEKLYYAVMSRTLRERISRMGP